VKLYYDLHIHSCLSPCADNDMTPANIAQLANMLELNAVALTDHNSCKNCPAFFEAAAGLDIIPIAGMELTTAEEIHVVCLFPTLAAAMEFDGYIYGTLPPVKNRTDVFGEQLIMNAADDVTDIEETLLISGSSAGIYELRGIVGRYGGVMFPAHIERSAFSLISSLGFVPGDCGFNTVEIRSAAAVENLKLQHGYLNRCGILHNSDAHRLDAMSVPDNFIDVPEKTAAAVLRWIDRAGA